MAQAFIGTSGWNYDSWSNGVFYPRRTKRARWLEFYAKHFGTVEVNNTFYCLPGANLFSEWRERTPPEFVFALKANRFITHMKKLADSEEHLIRFLRHAQALRPKLGVVLFQLPPFWKFNARRLNDFATCVAQQRIVPGLRIALEIRNQTWKCEACFEILKKRGIALVFSDWSGLRVEEPVTADFVFARRHGPGPRYSSSYTEASLRRDAKAIRDWLVLGLDVYLYFNNDAFAYAVRNALRLRELTASLDLTAQTRQHQHSFCGKQS